MTHTGEGGFCYSGQGSLGGGKPKSRNRGGGKSAHHLTFNYKIFVFHLEKKPFTGGGEAEQGKQPHADRGGRGGLFLWF